MKEINLTRHHHVDPLRPAKGIVFGIIYSIIMIVVGIVLALLLSK